MAASSPSLFTARALRTVRAARNLTLRDLAAQTGIRTATLSTAESGHLLLTQKQMDRLAAALQVEQSVLTLTPEDVLQRAHAGVSP